MNNTPAGTSADLADLAARTAVRLATPAPRTGRAGWGQSLADGAVGISLLHIERARTGNGTWTTVHGWLTAAAIGSVAATTAAGLYFGAPALAFALHTTAGRYQRTLPTVDTVVSALAHRRVDAALARIHRGVPARFDEYDIINGLTGIGAHLLHHRPDDEALPRILAYLVRLTRPLDLGDDTVPGWWVGHNPDLSTGHAAGHANLGLAHGIAGPLALLALAHRAGITVDAHLDAIDRIWSWYQTWQQDHPSGPWWPQWLTHTELRRRRAGQLRPGRPSWCYGTPGIARALQLAAIATGDRTRQRLAEQALAGCLTDPDQLARLTDPGLCHGTAGLYQTAWRAAADAADPHLAALVPADLLHRHATTDAPETGLLGGAAGLALACHTAASGRPPASGWDACLLIA